MLDQDWTMQQRLKGEISDIQELLGKQRDLRFKVELGEELKQPAPAAPEQHRPWKIDEKLSQSAAPNYPTVSRKSLADDDSTYLDAHKAFKAYWTARWADHFRKGGLPADLKIDLEFASAVEGTIEANHYWAMARCMAIEARLDHLENQTAELEKSGVRYGGVYQRANTYNRGSVVTHLGSAWVAIKDADVGVTPQDSPDIWQLMVKKGHDGKDATR
ncbi:hypothetical protein EN742_08255 [Mesorhizobium sp. M4A.F.Ca.ET.020.02.1.1]|uniref:hypothetical protein n=1 Tax=unclassified Mesorhizobium TaxID=325217 RepID=UPI000FD3787E|nr:MULTISPECIES: hypothetical protein [unclassified Mesorhizobium]RVD42200.1 hypothetical protein EN742_08255 [Mesorhizobium sp. M4A.F.Ca.ET.020.02.1.1]RWC20322.1 MAG: hypothetical protein EOS53_10045 [Mesorhizobium sp.]TIX61895.1 MAG: hypothetical protein E5V33_16620 [Mesorhizobium sp.]